MSRFVAGNLFLVSSMACAAVSQILLKVLLRELESAAPGTNWDAYREWLTVDRLFRGGLSMTLLVAGFLLWLAALSRLELSYAYPIACSSIVLVAFLSVWFLGESVTPRMWLGTVLVLVGIVLVTPTGG